MADQRHQRAVLVPVGVEVATHQIDLIGRAKLLHRSGFLPAPHDGLVDRPGQSAVVVELEGVADHVGDTQGTGHRLGVDGQRRRAEHDGVTASLVGSDDLAHQRIHPGRHLFGVQPLADLVEVDQRLAAQVARSPDQQPLELHAAELVAQRGLDHAHDLADPGLPPADSVTGVRGRRESGHQGAVEVEECPDRRPRRATGDLPKRIR